REKGEEVPAQREDLSQTASRRMVYDIPVEDGPLVGKEPPAPPEKKRRFFDRRPRVPSPDQLLTGERGEAAPAPAPEAQPTRPEFIQDPIVPPSPIPVVPPVMAAPPGRPEQPEAAPAQEAPAAQPEPK